MASKMAARRDEAAESMATLLELIEDDIGSGMDQRILSYLEPGEGAIDFRLLLRVLIRIVRRSQAQAGGVEEARSDRLAEAAGLRSEAEAAARELRAYIVFIRGLFAAFHGHRQASRMLGISGPTAQVTQPELLGSQGAQLLEMLTAAKRKSKGSPIDRDALAAELKPAMKRFERAQKARVVGNRKIGATADDKRTVTEIFAADLRECLDLAVAVCRFVGRPDLAQRLNASVRRGAYGRR